MTEAISIEEKFDHPCKQTCSGWKQGFEKGVASRQRLVNAAKALYGDLCAHDEQPSHYVSWGSLREAIEELRMEND